MVSKEKTRKNFNKCKSRQSKTKIVKAKEEFLTAILSNEP